MEAVKHIPLEDREAFKYALGATLVKNNAHWRAFETVFEVYFSLRGKQYALGDDERRRARPRRPRRRHGRWPAPRASRAVQGGGGRRAAHARGAGRAALPGAAARATRPCCGPSPARPCAASPAWSRAARSAAPTTCTARCGTSTSTACSTRLMEQARQDADGELTPLEERLEHDEYEHRIEQLKKEIEAEIRRRLVADRGVEAMAKTLRKPLPEDVDFMHASREEMAELRKALYPLTRTPRRAPGPQAPPRPQGPARLPQHRAPLAVSYGGVPAEPKFQYPRPAQARDLRHRRHLRVGRRLRPLHAAPRVRHQRPVLEGAVVRVHRRHRRGHPLLRGRRGHHRGRAPGQHRGRRRVGRRPLRLRPRLRGVLGAVGQGDRPEDDGDDPRRRPEQLPRLAVAG